jgi:hypothetical protein
MILYDTLLLFMLLYNVKISVAMRYYSIQYTVYFTDLPKIHAAG